MSEGQKPERSERPEAGLPERSITANQLVSYNLSYFRRAADRTQEDLGKQLGWTNVAVSAAERSWRGGRVRQFDADLTSAIALTLGVPVSALYLPPVDDGIEFSYRLKIPGGPDDGLTMEDWFLFFAGIEPEWAPDTPALRAYEERYVAAVSRYAEPDAAAGLAERMREFASEDQVAQALDAARSNLRSLKDFSDTIGRVINDNELLRKALTRALSLSASGRAELNATTWRAWDARPERRRWQRPLVELGREMFGDRGPENHEQLDRLWAEAWRSQRAADAVISGDPLIVYLDDGSLRLIEPGESSTEAGQ